MDNYHEYCRHAAHELIYIPHFLYFWSSCIVSLSAATAEEFRYDVMKGG